MQKLWHIKRPYPKLQTYLNKELGISTLLAQVLINRGIKTPKDAIKFLKPSFSSLIKPLRLPDMEISIKRIKRAIKNKEKVLIFSDYDADGITSLALLKSILLKSGLNTLHYIPHRTKEGYGLNSKFIPYFKEKKLDLLITLDCGITNHREIEELKKAGIDTIIIDHHEPSTGRLPRAIGVINPKRKDSLYPYKDLATIGLVYKFVQALTKENLEEELDIVCLGSVCDVVPINGENRILIKLGLDKLNSTSKVGLKALIDSCKLTGRDISCGYISYILGPRINVKGRLDCSEVALKLLLTESYAEALSIAKELNKANKERQAIEAKIMEEALDLAENQTDFKEERVIVLGKEGWHRGVLGIVASRIAERFHRPSIVISWQDNVGKGSGRSIKNFHLFEALLSCSEYLKDFGGHSQAAGLTILKDNIEIFKKRLNLVARQRLKPLHLYPQIDIDADIPLSILTDDLVEGIAGLAPFGTGNPYPVFCSRLLTVKGSPVIKNKGTLKFWVSDGLVTLEAVGFGMANYFELVSCHKNIDLVYSPKLNNWQGESNIQLEIEDIRPTND